ncbi:MAG: hypothetical protein QOF78_3359 [Phycisphaerales bacterium]|nr:hypothetical protein [Phycisphaerales bacterium]
MKRAAFSLICTLVAGVVVLLTGLEYGFGDRGGEVGISAAIGAGWALLITFVGIVVAAARMWRASGRRRNTALGGLLANVAVIVCVFASGLCR